MSGLVDQSADARSKTIGANFRVRAWVAFQGNASSNSDSTRTIRNSGNVSSVARNSSGTYDINFIQKPPSSDGYCAFVSGNINNSNNDGRRNERVIEWTQDSCKVITRNTGDNANSSEDFPYVNVIAIW